MKHKTPFEHHGFFVLRTPLLPFAELVALTDDLEAGSATGPELDAAIAHDRAVMQRRLRAFAMRPEVLEALFIASPSLVDQLERWQRDPSGPDGLKLERSLYKYAARMASRPTPFGLFAGVSVGYVGSATDLVLEPLASNRRHTRFDMDYIYSLTKALEHDPLIRAGLRLFPSSSLYRFGGRLRYAESQRSDDAVSYRLVSVEPTAYLEKTLERAANGARVGELARALVADDPEVTDAEAVAYVDELVDTEILVSELVPRLTGAVPACDLIEVLGDQVAGAATAKVLAEAQRLLEQMDRDGLGRPAKAYFEVHAQLSSLPVAPAIGRLFQVDLSRATPHCTIGPLVVEELLHATAIVTRIGRAHDGLTRFRAAFQARYEAREVPLVEVLDEDSGIGFDVDDVPGSDLSPLLRGLKLGNKPPDKTYPVEPIQRLVFEQFALATQRREREVVLDEDDLAKLPEPETDLPDAWCTSATLGASSAAAVDRGEFLIRVQGIAGPSGGCLFGRFGHADAALLEHTRAHLKAEASLRPEAIFAEIVHLPEGRMGNISSRPVLRDYEIAYLGRSSVAKQHQISVTDLVVAVEDSRVVLRSRRLGREVIPRLTNAHDFGGPSLGMYRFLCSLQRQPGTPYYDVWGALHQLAFLPRVRVGRVVLSLARWVLSAEDLDPLREAKHRSNERFRLARRMRDELALPRRVAIEDGDNALIVDFDNVLAIEALCQWIVNRPSVTVCELFPDPAELVVQGPGGGYCHEIVVPFIRSTGALRDRAVESTAAPPRPSTNVAVPRSFATGSEWLYVKLYAGRATLDEILVHVVEPVVREAIASGAIVRWFFIRYGDPDWHLRLRMRGDAARLLSEVLPALHRAVEPMRDDGRVWRVQCDTYEREVERYGGPTGIVLSEEIFELDSEAVVGLIKHLGDAVSPFEARWHLAVVGLDSLLEALGLQLSERHAAAAAARAHSVRATPDEQALGHQLGQRFREQRPVLDTLLDRTRPCDEPLETGRHLLTARDVKLAAVVEQLRVAWQAGALAIPISRLAYSYMHMFCNRLFPSSANAHEVVLYDFLERMYRSRIARAKRPG